jgi:hypothetical protein
MTWIQNKPSTAAAVQFLNAFSSKRMGHDDPASPPLIVGDSSYSAAKRKARWSLDPIPNMQSVKAK